MCVVVGYASRFGIDCGYCLLIWLGLLWCLVAFSSGACGVFAVYADLFGLF